MKVPAINKEVYTSFGSSSRSVMRLAAKCCFVFSIFTSLPVRENNATSAPEITKLSKRNPAKAAISTVVPCSVANNVNEVVLKKSIMAAWLSNAIGLNEPNQKGRSPGLPINNSKLIFKI